MRSKPLSPAFFTDHQANRRGGGLLSSSGKRMHRAQQTLAKGPLALDYPLHLLLDLDFFVLKVLLRRLWASTSATA